MHAMNHALESFGQMVAGGLCSALSSRIFLHQPAGAGIARAVSSGALFLPLHRVPHPY